MRPWRSWPRVRAVRYWNAKTSWRATFRAPGNCWAAAALVLAVLNLGPWRETLVFGQINILLMGLIAVDLLARNPRWTRGFPGSGFLVGVAAGIKLTPLAVRAVLPGPQGLARTAATWLPASPPPW